MMCVKRAGKGYVTLYGPANFEVDGRSKHLFHTAQPTRFVVNGGPVTTTLFPVIISESRLVLLKSCSALKLITKPLYLPFGNNPSFLEMI